SLPLLSPREVILERIGPLGAEPDLLRLLPPAWLVDSVLGDFSLLPNLERAAVIVAVIALAVAVPKLSGGSAYTDLLAPAPQAAPARPRLPWIARLLGRVPKIPIARKLLSPQAAALATLIVTHGDRDELGRRRLFALRMLLVILATLNSFVPHVGAPLTT